MTSPTQRSLKLLRDAGYTVAIVEHWNQWARVRQDLFGFIDLIGLRGEETLAVQTTSSSNMANRITKIRESPNLFVVLGAGWTVQVHGWKKVGNRWQCRTEIVTA